MMPQGIIFLFEQNQIWPQGIQLALAWTRDLFSETQLCTAPGAKQFIPPEQVNSWRGPRLPPGLGLRWWSVLHGMSQPNSQGRRDDNYCGLTNVYLGFCLIPLASKTGVWLVWGLRWYPFPSHFCPHWQVSDMEETEKPSRKKKQINHAHSWNADRSPDSRRRQVTISSPSEGVIKQGLLRAVDGCVIGATFLEAIWWFN